MSKKSIINEVKEEAKARKQAEKHWYKPTTWFRGSGEAKRVSFEVKTLFGWVGIILLVLGAYIAGVMSADLSNKAYNDAVRNEATALVDQLKSSK